MYFTMKEQTKQVITRLTEEEKNMLEVLKKEVYYKQFGNTSTTGVIRLLIRQRYNAFVGK